MLPVVHLEGTIKSFIMKLLHFYIPLGMFRSVKISNMPILHSVRNAALNHNGYIPNGM